MSSNYHFAFEKLDVYTKSIDFGEHVQVQIKQFPREELYALSSQYRRAADSIALNIAEGYPGSDAQFIKHLNIAIYSASECVVCSTKARLRLYISDKENEENRMLISELTKMLSSFRKHIRNKTS